MICLMGCFFCPHIFYRCWGEGLSLCTSNQVPSVLHHQIHTHTCLTSYTWATVGLPGTGPSHRPSLLFTARLVSGLIPCFWDIVLVLFVLFDLILVSWTRQGLLILLMWVLGGAPSWSQGRLPMFYIELLLPTSEIANPQLGINIHLKNKFTSGRIFVAKIIIFI